MQDQAITVERIEAYALSSAVVNGPRSSLAPMPTRNGLLIKLCDAEGGWGWGEAWCNFPPRGNLAKLLLLEDVIGPALLDTPVAAWEQGRRSLESRLARMEIHTGEQGPFSHLLAAIDLALADLAARRRGISLARLLSERPLARVPVYASSPAPERLDSALPDLLAAGHTAVKVKIGYDWDADSGLLDRVRRIAPDVELYVDANQAWAPDTAADRLQALRDWHPRFVEEPMRADRPIEDWSTLAASTQIPLAAGENILSTQRFAHMVEARALRVVQPDVIKWGGVTGAMAVGRHAQRNGARCFLHYMGTGLGLAASVQVMAALGGDGYLELDANDNPLRTDLGDIDLVVGDGALRVSEAPGIGFVPDPGRLAAMAVGSCVLAGS